MSAAGGVLPCHERLFRSGRVCVGARAKEPSGGGGGGEAPRRRGGPGGYHPHQRLPVRLPAGHHPGIAGHRLVGRAGGVGRARGAASGGRFAGRGGGPHLRGGGLRAHHGAARHCGRADSQIIRHLLHREVRPAHGGAAAGVLQGHLSHHGGVQRHHQRRTLATRSSCSSTSPPKAASSSRSKTSSWTTSSTWARRMPRPS